MKSFSKSSIFFGLLVLFCILVITFVYPPSRKVKAPKYPGHGDNDLANNELEFAAMASAGQDSFITDVDISDLEKVDNRLNFNWRRVSYNAETGKLDMSFPDPSYGIKGGTFDETTGILTIKVVQQGPAGAMFIQSIKDDSYQVPQQYIGKVRKIVLG